LETIKDNKVTCDECGWSWDLSDGGDDPYTCHKCGHDNSPKPKSNITKIMDKFKDKFPDELKPKVDFIEKFIVDYIKKNHFTVKFLNSCSTGFAGVRTKDQIIICSPNSMLTFGDFIYTIFHEIRHEIQVDKNRLGWDNPLSDFDLEDFENLSKHYWKLEMDADTFAKEMIAKLIIELDIPMNVAKDMFKLSSYIESYPSLSTMVLSQLKSLVDTIKQIKQQGGEYTDIQDHPMVKQYIHRLENFI